LNPDQSLGNRDAVSADGAGFAPSGGQHRAHRDATLLGVLGAEDRVGVMMFLAGDAVRFMYPVQGRSWPYGASSAFLPGVAGSLHSFFGFILPFLETFLFVWWRLPCVRRLDK